MNTTTSRVRLVTCTGCGFIMDPGERCPNCVSGGTIEPFTGYADTCPSCGASVLTEVPARLLPDGCVKIENGTFNVDTDEELRCGAGCGVVPGDWVRGRMRRKDAAACQAGRPRQRRSARRP